VVETRSEQQKGVGSVVLTPAELDPNPEPHLLMPMLD
jgi:hypothetical protein